MISTWTCFNGLQFFFIESLLHVNASCGAISTQQLAEELHKPIIRKTKNVKYNIF